jgi:hypothetical protein
LKNTRLEIRIQEEKASKNINLKLQQLNLPSQSQQEVMTSLKINKRIIKII